MEWLIRAIAYGTFSPSRRSGAAAVPERLPPI
jgi:hypothetical protein